VHLARWCLGDKLLPMNAMLVLVYINNMMSVCCRIVYWTDTVRGTISASLSDGRYKLTLFSGKSFQPLDIVVNPSLG